MSMSLMAAVSQDGLMFSLAALSAAIMARAVTGGTVPAAGGPVPPRSFAVLVVCLALIGMARPPYAALAPVVLAIPGVRSKARIAGAGAVVASTVLWSLLAAALSQVPLARSDVVPDPRAQIDFLLESPSRIVAVAVQTMDTYLVHYRQQFIGQ